MATDSSASKKRRDPSEDSNVPKRRKIDRPITPAAFHSSTSSEGSPPQRNSQEPETADLSPFLGFSGLSRSMAARRSELSWRAAVSALVGHDVNQKIQTLQQLYEWLSFANENSMTSFPTDVFVPIILNILDNDKRRVRGLPDDHSTGVDDEPPAESDESRRSSLATFELPPLDVSGEEPGRLMCLAANCLYMMLDILPNISRSVVGCDGLAALFDRLRDIEFIDVAENILRIVTEKLADEQPLAVLKAGGLEAMLQYLDFFPLDVQRKCLKAVSMITGQIIPLQAASKRQRQQQQQVNHDQDWIKLFEEQIEPILPCLSSLTLSSQHDDQLLGFVCRCWRNVVDFVLVASELADGQPDELSLESFQKKAERDRQTVERQFERIASHGVVGGICKLLTTAICIPQKVGGRKISMSDILAAFEPDESQPLGGSPRAANAVRMSPTVLLEPLSVMSTLAYYSTGTASALMNLDENGRTLMEAIERLLDVLGTPSIEPVLTTNVLSLVASLLPAVLLSHDKTFLKVDPARVALISQNPDCFCWLASIIMPRMPTIFNASLSPDTQLLAFNLILSFILTSVALSKFDSISDDAKVLIHAGIFGTPKFRSSLVDTIASVLMSSLDVGCEASQRNCSSRLAALVLCRTLLESDADEYSNLLSSSGIYNHLLAVNDDHRPHSLGATVAIIKTPKGHPLLAVNYVALVRNATRDVLDFAQNFGALQSETTRIDAARKALEVTESLLMTSPISDEAAGEIVKSLRLALSFVGDSGTGPRLCPFSFERLRIAEWLDRFLFRAIDHNGVEDPRTEQLARAKLFLMALSKYENHSLKSTVEELLIDLDDEKILALVELTVTNLGNSSAFTTISYSKTNCSSDTTALPSHLRPVHTSASLYRTLFPDEETTTSTNNNNSDQPARSGATLEEWLRKTLNSGGGNLTKDARVSPMATLSNLRRELRLNVYPHGTSIESSATALAIARQPRRRPPRQKVRSDGGASDSLKSLFEKLMKQVSGLKAGGGHEGGGSSRWTLVMDSQATVGRLETWVKRQVLNAYRSSQGAVESSSSSAVKEVREEEEDDWVDELEGFEEDEESSDDVSMEEEDEEKRPTGPPRADSFIANLKLPEDPEKIAIQLYANGVPLPSRLPLLEALCRYCGCISTDSIGPSRPSAGPTEGAPDDSIRDAVTRFLDKLSATDAPETQERQRRRSSLDGRQVSVPTVAADDRRLRMFDTEVNRSHEPSVPSPPAESLTANEYNPVAGRWFVADPFGCFHISAAENQLEICWPPVAEILSSEAAKTTDSPTMIVELKPMSHPSTTSGDEAPQAVRPLWGFLHSITYELISPEPSIDVQNVSSNRRRVSFAKTGRLSSPIVSTVADAQLHPTLLWADFDQNNKSIIFCDAETALLSQLVTADSQWNSFRNFSNLEGPADDTWLRGDPWTRAALPFLVSAKGETTQSAVTDTVRSPTRLIFFIHRLLKWSARERVAWSVSNDLDGTSSSVDVVEVSRSATTLLKSMRYAFRSSALSSRLLVQLCDPVAIASCRIAPWAAGLATCIPALFPFECRRQLNQALCDGVIHAMLHFRARLRDAAVWLGIGARSSALPGLSAAPGRRGSSDLSRSGNQHIMLSLVSQIFGATPASCGADAGGVISSRRQNDILSELDSAVPLPRTKVKLQRQQLLVSAMKVMSHYDHLAGVQPSSPLLDVEYFNEEGLGSGPTLEFYSDVVAQLLSFSVIKLFRDDRPDGFIFPQPHLTNFAALPAEELARPRLSPLAPGVPAERSNEEESRSATEPESATTLSTPDENLTPWDHSLLSFSLMMQLAAKSAVGTEGIDGGEGLNVAETSWILFKLFKFLGLLTAKAIIDSRRLDLRLHPLFWKLVTGDVGQLTMADLLQVDPNSFKMLRTIEHTAKADPAAVEAMALSFALPGTNLDLVPNGSSQILTSDRVDEYCKLFARASLWDGIKLQVYAFRFGFASLLPLWGLRLFDLDGSLTVAPGVSLEDDGEVSVRLFGATSCQNDSFWTIEHLQSFILPDHGYSVTSQTFIDFLLVLSEFHPEERRSFLKLCTGVPMLPARDGFAGLRPLMRVVKKTDDHLTVARPLPSVMTCSNYLKLPDYQSKDLLRSKLLLAMADGQGAFALS